MSDLRSAIDQWREANRRLKTIVLTAGAALAFLFILALVQLGAVLYYHWTLRDMRQGVERTRQEAFEALQQQEQKSDEPTAGKMKTTLWGYQKLEVEK